MKAIDCATPLTDETAKALAKNGIDIVCRYLGDSWKTIGEDEAKSVMDAGLKIVSIWETDPTRNSYFTEEQGKQDAQKATKYANQLGQPNGTPIYFAVDYGGGNSNLGNILEYFKAIKANLEGYKVGGYGSFTVVKYLHEHGAIEYVWQTLAWSSGEVYGEAHLYQKRNGQRESGVSVDIDQVFKDPGAWALAKHIDPPKEKVDAVHIKAGDTYRIEDGDTFWALENKWGLHHGTLQRLNPSVKPKKLSVGQKIHVPAAVRKPEHHSNDDYTVHAGDVLSKIAKAHGTSVSELMKLNPQIKDKDRIYVGEKIHLPNGSHTHPHSPAKKFYVIRSGDVLSRIADRFHTSVAHLMAINPQIENKNRINAGQKIRIK